MAQRKILIDGYNLSLEEGTGIATYARNLSYCIHELGYDVHVLYGTRGAPRNMVLREIAFFDAQSEKPSLFTDGWRHIADRTASLFGQQARPVPVTGRVITRSLTSRLPYFDQLWNAPRLFTRAVRHFDFYRSFLTARIPSDLDLVHWTYPLPVRAARAKNIYTIHDLIPLRLPYTTLDIKRRYYRAVKRIARDADHIVTVSENSKKDIVNLLGIAEERVTNTYQAVEIPEKYTAKPDSVVKREIEGVLNLTYKGYMLYLGAIEPKKNVGRLIEAFLGSSTTTPLLVVGKPVWRVDQDFRLLADGIVRYLEQLDNFTLTRHRIQRIEHVSFSLMVTLIRGAKAVLFPSLYEGFGLPVLEAMTLGTPVLSSTEGSVPEVAGDAALLVDPYDAHAIAEGIRALDGNAELRASLIDRGRARAALFSAENYKKRLAELYRRLI